MNGLKVSGIYAVPEKFNSKGVVIFDSRLREGFANNIAREGYIAYSVCTVNDEGTGENIILDDSLTVLSAFKQLYMFCEKLILISFSADMTLLEEVVKKFDDIDAIIFIDPKFKSSIESIFPEKISIRIISKEDIASIFPVVLYEEHEGRLFEDDIPNEYARMQLKVWNEIVNILQFV